MSKAKVLLIGGGYIATEKLEKLLDFTRDITIIAQEFSPQCRTLIDMYALHFTQRGYAVGDIEGYDIVIVATNTVELHKVIYKEARESRVLVNSVDDTQYCDFIFPSYIKKGDLTVAFSTGGASPAFAKYIRSYFQKMIPESVVPFLEQMKRLRKEMKKGKERMEYFDQLVDQFFRDNFK